jgi:fatty acid desaturase
MTAPIPATPRDYSLVGRNAAWAVENGLATAEWYHTDIPRKRMKELMQRRDGPAIRDTAIWLGAFVVFAAGAILFYGTWWSVPFFICYGVLYGGSTDSRWHECGHGTAFKTRWMNAVIYHLACFMIIREPTIWRWSHARHHTDTIIVGRDPEIAVMRPTVILKVIGHFFAIPGAARALLRVLYHATGRLTADEKTFVPESEWPKVYLVARVWTVIHIVPVALALYFQSWLPVLLVGPLPAMYGAWLEVIFGTTQHAGLAENVLDHRLNSRTVYMNPLFRFLYWNMNYHVEHHMFPMVPYHRLPELHEIMKPDTPTPYGSLLEAYREIIPTLLRQARDPEYYAKRELPPTARPYRPDLHGQVAPAVAPAE